MSVSKPNIFLVKSVIMASTKKYHCCFPGCTTYDTLDFFFNLPCETYWREQWLLKIPRKDWVVDASTIACKKHFLKPINISTESIQDKNKTLKLVRTRTIPTIISSHHNNQSVQDIYQPQTMFEIYDRDVEFPSNFSAMVSQDTDFIGAYTFFMLMYQKRLEICLDNPWKVDMNREHTIFYTVDFFETPRIRASVKVDKYLSVSVTLAGKTMDPLDLTWILPITGKIHRWSQLQTMLLRFGQ